MKAASRLTLHQRNLLYLTTPGLWPLWPYLPLVRRRAGQEEECGVLVDVMKSFGVPGYSSTVFRAIVFEMPDSLNGMLKLPRETYDTSEEIFIAGWRVD